MKAVLAALTKLPRHCVPLVPDTPAESARQHRCVPDEQDRRDIHG